MILLSFIIGFLLGIFIMKSIDEPRIVDLKRSLHAARVKYMVADKGFTDMLNQNAKLQEILEGNENPSESEILERTIQDFYKKQT